MLDLAVLGRRVQTLRRERSLTLQQLADAAEVSVSMLSSIERGQKAPTVVVLSRVADGLGVAIGTLLADLDDHRVVVRRAADQDTAVEPGGWRRTVMSPVVPGVNVELVRSTLPPGCDAGSFPAYAPGSHEFVAVESGFLRLTIGERTVEVAAGDSVYFAADTVHGYANDVDTPCTYYVVALIMRPRPPSPAAS